MGFMGWIGIWAALLHFVVAITNACELVRIVTRFSCEIFGLLIGVIFIESATREVVNLWDESSTEGAILSLLLALATFYCCATFHHGNDFISPILYSRSHIFTQLGDGPCLFRGSED